MEKFDDQYLLLEKLYEDDAYPEFFVDKIKYLLVDFINYLESKPPKLTKQDIMEIGDKLYDLFVSANALENELYTDSDEEINCDDALFHECLVRDVEYIIKWFHVPIDMESALAEREWE